jgi:hypothetical protein
MRPDTVAGTMTHEGSGIKTVVTIKSERERKYA